MAESVFADLAASPEEAANLTARGLLMIAIEQHVREQGWTQAEAAAHLRVTQPRVSDLLNGKITKFSLDALVNMLAPVGLMFDVRPIERPPAQTSKKRKAAAKAAVSVSAKTGRPVDPRVKKLAETP